VSEVFGVSAMIFSAAALNARVSETFVLFRSGGNVQSDPFSSLHRISALRRAPVKSKNFT
jgi:hypothetical protein